MALLLRDLVLTLQQDESRLRDIAAARLSLDPEQLSDFRIVRRGIDARKKPHVKRVYSVIFTAEDEAGLLRRSAQLLQRYEPPSAPQVKPLGAPRRLLVVGMGPAGLFAALYLARSGARVTLVERGAPLEERVPAVERFWSCGELDPESNVQFGEGGAGTFSDGKLTTRIKHPWVRYVLETLVDFGAPESILVDARPHVGTDRLRSVLRRFRAGLLELGVEIRFSTRLTGLLAEGGRVRGGVLNDAEELPADGLVLAPGHSARDTYAMLHAQGVAMEAKPFAVGLRVEHPVDLINRIQYGCSRHPLLPPADYRLAWNDPQSGRGVYSFCMCPGGEVILSSSEAGGVVVNGMSRYRRDTAFSNSALVVSVGPADFAVPGPLGGVDFQRQLEGRAFQAGGGGYHAPAQNLLDFQGTGKGTIRATCRPGVRAARLDELLPAEIVAALRRALPRFERRMPGFVSAEGVLIGVESRTSAPLRILRGEDGASSSHAGLYPAGEGAGYAGGIMSAALDGLRAADHLVHHQA